jgi:hypothetical protein
MHRHGISYKNLYKYDFVNLYENMHSPSKPKYISYRNSNKNFLNTEYQNTNKTQTNYNKTSKNFYSFHKSLLHLKLSTNPRFKNNENICYTERSSNEKKHIQNFKNIYEKVFITNTEEKKRDINKYPQIITDYKTKFNKNLLNSDYMSIPSDTFLPFNKNKFMYFLPDIINEKISDFRDDLKLLRTVKYVNEIKIDRQRKNKAFLDLNNEENEIQMHSLKKSMKLINIYKKCFGEYNKFLVNEIKKEKKLLNDFNWFKKGLEDQVNILQKQFNDIMKELEIVNNFKLIFTAIKNKKKLEDVGKASKIYIEELKKKLKKEIIIKRKKISFANILPLNKSKSRKEKPRKSSKNAFSLAKSNKQTFLNKNEKSLDVKKRFRKSVSIITVTKAFKKKLERYNSFQNFSIEKRRNFEKPLNKSDNLDYDIDRNENILVNSILKFLDIYNEDNSKIVNLKLEAENEANQEQKNNNKLLENQNNDLLYVKSYNKSLLTKYKILYSHKNDYTLLIAIYKKVNKIISSVICFKIKNFNHIIDRLRNIYDKNKLYYKYKAIKNDPKSNNEYFDRELINYIYIALSIIEILQCELISKKNEYLDNNYYQEQILQYENKMDTAKKIINNREKRNKDLLRKQEIYEKAIKKSNKIVFKIFRQAPRNYPFKIKENKNIRDKENEDEEFLFYH